ncbi:hypothetical protein BH09BAC2_BH09BAC2_08640 [soil metagenome]
MTKRKYNIKNILATILWILIGTGTIALLVAAVTNKENKRCQSFEINISGVQNIVFIDEKDVMNIIDNTMGGKVEGRSLRSFNLSKLETALQQSDWIKKADVFFDNNEKLWINISEREPIARVFTLKGSSFYIDTSLKIIPLSEKFSARLPVFTGYTDSIARTKEDSSLLNDIKNLSIYILRDSFWMAQIDQVDINAQKNFELIPKIGNQQIFFGDATNYQTKFSNLFSFYKNVQSKVGWNKYSKIDVQYKGQIIAIRRDALDVKMDSLRTVQIMQMILTNAQRQSGDTASVQLTQVDENTQQLIPLVNDELPNENVSMGNKIVVLQENEKPVLMTSNNSAAVSKISTPVLKKDSVKVTPAALKIISTPKSADKKMVNITTTKPAPLKKKSAEVTKPRKTMVVQKPLPKTVMPKKQNVNNKQQTTINNKPHK